MKISLENITKTFITLEKDLKDEQKSKEKIIVNKLLEDLRSKTPIDTGLARKSWIQHQTVDGFKLENTTEYIEHLNNGSSKQAPKYFIEKTAIEYGTPLGQIVEPRKI
jgi:hypothetical protein